MSSRRWRKGRNGEADGGEPEGEIGQQQSLTGHLAKRGLRGGQHHGAARRAILKGFEDAEQQSLARRREQVDAIEVGEAAEGGGIGVGDQPFAGVAALKGGCREGRTAVEIAGQSLLAGAGLAFKRGHL